MSQVHYYYVVWLLNGQGFIGNCVYAETLVEKCKIFDLLWCCDFSSEPFGSKFGIRLQCHDIRQIYIMLHKLLNV